MNEKTDIQKTIFVHCNECGHETNHNILHQVSRRQRIHYEDPPYFEETGSKWKLLQCCGCEEVTLQRSDWFSEDIPRNTSLPTYFPPRVSRKKPKWAEGLDVPDEYTELLNEIYVALHTDSRCLAMMGARALIDAVIRRSVGDQGNFKEGLKKLVEKQLISERNREIIDVAINVGNASAHRGHRPSPSDVNTTIDIVENLVHNELLAEAARTLKSNTPQREKMGKKV